MSRLECEEKEEKEEKDEATAKQLLETRTIVISESVDGKLADRIIRQILILEKRDPDSEIKIFINSPGGEIYSGYAIFDLCRFVRCPITTVVLGLAASMGSILSLAADKGRKFALPNAKIMIHQPMLHGAQGQTTDLEIHSRQILKTRQGIAELYAEVTGKKVKQILY